MSLIECTECGKKFSDKAEVCPKCSCPTSEVKKAIDEAKQNKLNNIKEKKKEKKPKDKNKTKEKSKANSKKKKIILLSTVVILIVAIITFLALTIFNNEWKNANKSFEAAYEIAQKKNLDLEDLIGKSEKIVYSEKMALDEELRPILETAISEAKAAKKELPSKSLLIKEINKKTAELNNLNYDEIYNKLEQAYTNLDKSIRKYDLVNKPTEAYVINCLKTVNHVKNIAAVTEDNDPNGNLNKPGGYTATVYYSDDRIKLDKSIYGKTIIDQGTDGGGAVEVYTCVEDAIKRRDYLATYDGSIFANGSHTVVGTVLVRTSNELTATQQKDMEKAIIDALTKLEEEKTQANTETKKEETKTESSKDTTKEQTKTETVKEQVKKEKVVFTGGTTAKLNWNGKGKLNTKTKFSEGEEVNFTGKISGFTGKKDITLIQKFPNGETYTDTFDVTSGDVIGFGYVDCGVGNGSFTVKLTKTGEVLGHYTFTIQ